MSTDHEVLGNYDYTWAAREKLKPKTGHEPRFLGRVARLLFEETTIGKMKSAVEGMTAWWKKKRAEEKDDRTYNGSLAEIQHTIVPLEEEYHMPVENQYHGRHRQEDHVLPVDHATPDKIDDNMAEVMQAAVRRVRQNLGRLPVLSMADSSVNIPQQARPEAIATRPSHDNEILARLELAFNRPGIRDGDRNTAAGQPRDDELTSTTAK